MNFLANPIHCYIYNQPSRKNMIYKKEKDPNAVNSLELGYVFYLFGELDRDKEKMGDLNRMY